MKAETGDNLDHDSSDDEDEEEEQALVDEGMDEESDPGSSPVLGPRGGGKRNGSNSTPRISGSSGALEKLETRMGSIVPGSGAEKIFGHGFDSDGAAGLGLRPGTARPGTRGGRPGTADGEGRRIPMQKNVSRKSPFSFIALKRLNMFSLL